MKLCGFRYHIGLSAFRLYDRSGKTLDELITTVASKGGTTYAAFEVLDEYKMREGLPKD